MKEIEVDLDNTTSDDQSLIIEMIDLEQEEADVGVTGLKMSDSKACFLSRLIC